MQYKYNAVLREEVLYRQQQMEEGICSAGLTGRCECVNINITKLQEKVM